ncbi:MAG: tellurite resistance/C4-dicarboxylate transporter family protein [Chloroflexi bacterium]|nr:tellurite resistance/C4-dicarboxylate transporter family protein [Chloroflexota bacterium]
MGSPTQGGSSSGSRAEIGWRFLVPISNGAKGLPPAYFAMVMATGIISIAANLFGMRPVAIALFGIGLVAYVILWLLTLLRFVQYTHQVMGDLVDHVRGPGFFTSVAATSVLGTQFIAIWRNYLVGALLLVVAVALWIGLTYTIFTGLTIKENKPSLGEGITGAWLLAVVATQSLAVLSASLAPHLEQPHRLQLNFFAFSMWLWGGMLYIWMISLIFYRYTFFKFSPGDLTPPYWINMGAMAISTLAGAVLITNATPEAPFLNSTLPFLKGFTVFFWATGTWWVPMLAILAVWRHVYKRFPLAYDPLFWGAVFPLGMYSVGTFYLAEAMHLEFLEMVPRFFFYVALLAWLITFTGLVRSLYRGLAQALRSASSADERGI